MVSFFWAAFVIAETTNTMEDPFSKIIGIMGIVGVPLAIVTWVVTKFIPSLFAELKVQRETFLLALKEQSAAAANERQEFEKQVIERENNRETSVEKRLGDILASGEKRDEKMATALQSIVYALNSLSELITGKAIREEIEANTVQEKQRAGARAILEEKHKERPGR